MVIYSSIGVRARRTHQIPDSRLAFSLLGTLAARQTELVRGIQTTSEHFGTARLTTNRAFPSNLRHRLRSGVKDEYPKHRQTFFLIPRGKQTSEEKSGINPRPAPPLRPYTLGPADSTNNLLKEQFSKQQKNNFHSSSLKEAITTFRMVSQNVNKTALHPGGVQ